MVPLLVLVPPRLAEQAIRVRGGATYGSVSRAAVPVAQVPPVLFGGARPPYVSNLQTPVALKRSSRDGPDLRRRPSYGDPASLGQFPDRSSRASHPRGSKPVSGAADLTRLDVLRLAATLFPGFPLTLLW